MDSLFAPTPSGARHDLLGSAALPTTSVTPWSSAAPAATSMPWSRAEALDDFLAKTMDRLMEPMAKEFAARLAASDPKPPATATTSPLLIRPVSSPSPDIAVNPITGQPLEPEVGLWYNEIWQKILERNFDSNNAADVAVTTQAWKSLSAANLTEQTVEAAIRPVLAVTQESANDISQAFQDIGQRPATAAETGMVEGWEASPSIAGSLDATRWWLANQGAGGFDGIDVTDKVLQDYADILQRAPTMPGQVPAGQTDELDAARFYIKDHTTPAFRVSLATGPESTSDLTNTFNQVLGRPPNASDLNTWQTYLGAAPGNTLANLREFIATWGGATNECATAINNVYLSILNRPASATDIAGWQTALGAGSSLHDLRVACAQCPEGVNDIQGVYQAVLGRAASPGEVSTVQSWLINGQQTMAGLRPAATQWPECVSDIKGMYQSLFDRQPSNTELSWAQGQLAGAQTLAQLRQSLATDAEEVTDLTNLYWNIVGRAPDTPGLQGWEGVLAAGTSLDQVRQQMAQTGEAVGDVTNEYLTILGRTPSATETSNAETVLGNGTQTLAGLRTALANGSEAATDTQTFIQSLFGRAASASEVAGFAAAYASPLFAANPTVTVTGLTTTFADHATANSALTELAVYLAQNSGVTPTITLSDGERFAFTDATEAAALLLGLALGSGTATASLLQAYNAAVAYVAQIDQPDLLAARAAMASSSVWQAQGGTIAANFYNATAGVDLAFAAASLRGHAPDKLLLAARQFIAAGNAAIASQNFNLVDEMRAGADICLQLVNNPALQRLGPYAERVYQANGATTVDVAVDPTSSDPFGTATYHSKDQTGGILAYLLPVITTILDIAAAVFPETGLPFAAAALNAGEAGASFAQGDVLGGLIHVGAAVGFGELGFGGAAANTATAEETAIGNTVLAVTGAVGATAGIVQGAGSGNVSSIVASVLEDAAALAGGALALDQLDPSLQLVQNAALVSQIAAGLSVAGGVTAAAGALAKGQVVAGLVDALGPVLSVGLAATNLEDTADATAAGQPQPGAANQTPGYGPPGTPTPPSAASGQPLTNYDVVAATPAAASSGSPAPVTAPTVLPSGTAVLTQPNQVTLATADGGSIRTFIDPDTGTVFGSTAVYTQAGGGASITGSLGTQGLYNGNVVTFGYEPSNTQVTVQAIPLAPSAVAQIAPSASGIAAALGISQHQAQTLLGIAELAAGVVLGASSGLLGPPTGGLSLSGEALAAEQLSVGAALLAAAKAGAGGYLVLQGASTLAGHETIVFNEAQEPTPQGNGGSGTPREAPSYKIGDPNGHNGMWINAGPFGDPLTNEAQQIATNTPLGVEYQLNGPAGPVKLEGMSPDGSTFIDAKYWRESTVDLYDRVPFSDGATKFWTELSNQLTNVIADGSKLIYRVISNDPNLDNEQMANELRQFVEQNADTSLRPAVQNAWKGVLTIEPYVPGG